MTELTISPKYLVGRKILVIFAAILYSVFLAVSALITAGAGDGSYVFLSLFSAPFSLLEYVLTDCLFLFFSIPIVWVAAGIIGVIKNEKKRQNIIKVFLGIHYISALIVLIFPPELYGRWKFYELWKYPYPILYIFVPFAIYLLGQIWLWKQLKHKVIPEEKEQAN